MECPPILFLIFNRPDLTRQVFARIRAAQPSQLYVAADGPRANRPYETNLCAETRAILDLVDWPCEIHTLLRDENVGCRVAISSGITWFFEHVEEGIILEDDCVPDPTFFRYCAELLAHYRHDERIMMISGTNFDPRNHANRASYYFSANLHIWGWATWRRAWQYYEGTLAGWPALRASSWLENWHHSANVARHWTAQFDMMHDHPIDTWDIQWVYSVWLQHGLAIQPYRNLISNIGFDARATHTSDEAAREANLPTSPLSFPLVHPTGVVRNHATERYVARWLFGIQPRWRSLLARRLRYLRPLYFRLFPPNPIAS